MTRAELKQRAREALGNNIFGTLWLSPLLFLVVAGVVLSVTGSIVPGIGALLISGPVSAGLAYCFLKQARTKEVFKIEDTVSGFKQFGDNFLLGFLMSLFISLWSMLFVIPGIIKTYAYSMCFYIKADHPEYNWKQCLDESQKMMKGHKWQLFVLQLSFIGWFIVGSLCLGVGTLWVATYEAATIAQFYESIK